MLGAIIGDIAGSCYEFHNTNDYNFPLYHAGANYTDDTVMTVAVADWLTHDADHAPHALASTMRHYGRTYACPMGGYGGMFRKWLHDPSMPPYGSWGNGSAMRVSAVGWMFDTLDETERVAKVSAGVSHNHPEGIRGAVATAAAIYMARTGRTKDEIRQYVESRFGYDLSRPYDNVKASYQWDGSCQGTVPEAIIAFLTSRDFEDSIRLAVALGGDSDTLACINGGIAEAFYRTIPSYLVYDAWARLPDDFKQVVRRVCDASCYTIPVPDAPDARRFTPDVIDRLAPDEVFVFGSNLGGMHGGGAARAAYKNFGAVWGQGVGLQGQSYAIPTMQGGVETIAPYVDEFIAFASQHTELTFLVTRIGCGIAGFRDSEIAPLFSAALAVPNIILPRTFYDHLTCRD